MLRHGDIYEYRYSYLLKVKCHVFGVMVPECVDMHLFLKVRSH